MDKYIRYGIEPRKPISGTWKKLGWHEPSEGFIYESPFGIRVISSVHVMEGKREFHVSITDKGTRIPASVVPQILSQFGGGEWDEDNHDPNGKARHFWLKIDEPPKACDCKQNETPVIEGDYVWREDREKV